MTANIGKVRRHMNPIMLVLTSLIIISSVACEQVNQSGANEPRQAQPGAELSEPTITAGPTAKSGDDWQVISSDSLNLTVTAPGAQSVKILYRPTFAEDRHIELRTLTHAANANGGTFSTQLKVPSDFAGDVWAEAFYPNGERKEAKPIALTAESVPSSVAGETT